MGTSWNTARATKPPNIPNCNDNIGLVEFGNYSRCYMGTSWNTATDERSIHVPAPISKRSLTLIVQALRRNRFRNRFTHIAKQKDSINFRTSKRTRCSQQSKTENMTTLCKTMLFPDRLHLMLDSAEREGFDAMTDEIIRFFSSS